MKGVKSINNKSGVTYDIINLNENNQGGTVKLYLLEKKVANRKKGIGEFDDLTMPFNPNIDKNYMDCVKKYPNVFKQYKGIFSNMYEMARKNGNLVVPFRKEKINDKNNKPINIKK